MSARKPWARLRARSGEDAEATPAGPAHQLTAAHRCDRCGAQAYVRVLLPSLHELLFCGHHNRQYASALAKIAVEIVDETGRLAAI